jgi:hypothetical protein
VLLTVCIATVTSSSLFKDGGAVASFDHKGPINSLNG